MTATTRRLVIEAGHDRARDGSGASVPVATHGYAYDWRDRRHVECDGRRYLVEDQNTPGHTFRAHYLVVDVIGAEAVSLSSIATVQRRGLRCRVVESWQWPGVEREGDEILITLANYGSAVPDEIPEGRPVPVVTRQAE